VYKISTPLAYAMLCNPLVFIMEGARASLLGQEGFLPWSVCCGALVAYTAVIWFHMYYKMKRLLDFV
jgi:ABC-type polysaccharide/polyol phosphate export permease